MVGAVGLIVEVARSDIRLVAEAVEGACEVHADAAVARARAVTVSAASRAPRVWRMDVMRGVSSRWGSSRVGAAPLRSPNRCPSHVHLLSPTQRYAARPPGHAAYLVRVARRSEPGGLPVDAPLGSQRVADLAEGGFGADRIEHRGLR